MKKCLLDPFTLAWLELHPGNDAGGEQAIAELCVICAVLPTESGKVERGHSRFRRLAIAQSTGTHTATFRYLNAQVVCQHFRQRSVHCTKGFVQKHRLKSKVYGRAPCVYKKPAKAKRSGGGGSWRFYINQTSLEKKQTSANLAIAIGIGVKQV